MELIDSHVHLYPPEISSTPAAWAVAHGEPHWSLLCTRTRKDGRPVQTFPRVDELLCTMDAQGVARVVLQGWYWETEAACALQNAFYAECIRAHPDRLSACAAILPRRSAIDSVKRAADAGFVGLGELSPHSQGIASDAHALHDVLALAGALGLAVNCHVTEPLADPTRKTYPGRVETSLVDFVCWAELHPKTRFVLAHWGGLLPLDKEWGAKARTLTNLYYDTAASPLVYGSGASVRLWREMVECAGEDRVLFGTDFPLVLYPKKETAPTFSGLVAEARESGLTEKELVAVFSENTKRVFSI